MGLDILLGLQWGDEGKGKIVDVLAPQYDIVARFQGGPNAGHTLNIKGKEIVLHTIPSGIIHKNVANVIGTGMVIDPATLKNEIDKLKADGLFDENKLLISKNAQIILPTHRKLDAAKEVNAAETKIGSTLKGIGPSYTDKTARKGIRIREIFSENFNQQYEQLSNDHLARLTNYDAEEVSQKEENDWWDGIRLLRQLNIVNTEEYLNTKLEAGSTVLAEGAQGTFLDLDFGTYPYVTSSNTISANACLGLGVPPTEVNNIFGVTKAYTTRVGEGPFPTELLDEEGQKLREKGNEFGATTGRPRRCGWLDLEGLKYANKLNGVTNLVITKSDVLAGLSEVKICDGFSKSLSREEYPEVINGHQDIVPNYKIFQSWNGDIANISSSSKLPDELRAYLDFIMQATDKQISILSTGPQRNQYVSM